MKKISLLLLWLSFAACHMPGVKTGKISGTPGPLHDRHVHVMSPGLIAQWKSMGIPFSREDMHYTGIDTILARTGAGSVTLVSMAYVYASGEFGGGTGNTEQRIREENDYLAEAKKKFPGRIKAFYGIDPLQPGAMEEIRRCHTVLKLDGIKLHHNASQVYLTVPAHTARIKEIFRYASGNNIPILLHFDNGHRKFGQRDVQILADSVLAGLAPLTLQVAHFGTSGGFTPRTMEMIGHFLELYRQQHPATKHNILFDISAVCLDKDSEGVKKLAETEFNTLAGYCRKLGFERIVFGSDYPLYGSREYLALLKEKLKLTEKEMAELLRDK